MHDDVSVWIETRSYTKWYRFWNVIAIGSFLFCITSEHRINWSGGCAENSNLCSILRIKSQFPDRPTRSTDTTTDWDIEVPNTITVFVISFIYHKIQIITFDAPFLERRKICFSRANPLCKVSNPVCHLLQPALSSHTAGYYRRPLWSRTAISVSTAWPTAQAGSGPRRWGEDIENVGENESLCVVINEKEEDGRGEIGTEGFP
jgi:hypothetical protein